MAHIIADRVKETTTTTGTGNVTLLGAVSKFLAFSARMANGDTCLYAIVHQTANEWEVGVGTFVSATPALARTTVLASSNSDTAVTFSAGTKDVFLNYAAGGAISLYKDGPIAWTSTHDFTALPANAAPLNIKNAVPRFEMWETDQAADEIRWRWNISAKLFLFGPITDAGTSLRTVFGATRGTGTAISAIEIGNSTDLPPTTIWGPIEVGHASDTTWVRGAAGEIDIEGDRVWNQGNVHTQIGAATEDTTPDGAADFLATQDVSAAALKKVRLDKLPGALKHVGITIDGGGSVIAVGEKKLTLEPGLTGTIVGWTLAGDQSGSIVMDVWKADAAIPTNANSITASAKPTLSTARRANSTTLTGWTTAITADDVFIFEVESVTSLTHVTLTLLVRATGAQYP